MKTLLPDSLTHRNVFKTGFMLALLLMVRLTHAQSYLPNYSFTPTITTYTPISGGTLIDTGAVDDNDYYGYSIGFPFMFNGTTYTTFSINSNGVLVFGSSYSYVNNTAAMWDYYSASNAVMALNADIMGHATASMRFDNFGTAPNRYLVVQWSDFGFWNSSGDTENFQIVLRETSNAIEFNYGFFTKGSNDHYTSVGIRGSTYGEYINQATATDWAATAAGGSMYDQCLLSNNGPVLPYDGLTFAFNPPPLSYVSSQAFTASSQTIAPGAVDQKMIGFSIETYGMSGYLPVSQITVSTGGSTNVSDIANLKLYYSGSSNTFSTATQFGSTVSSPGASNTITDSVNLSEGMNYFWVTYDLAPGATIGNTVDAAITLVKTKNTNHVPTVTAPSGSRLIEAPMSFVGASVVQPFVQKVGQGTVNNQVIAVQVITSSTGAPINVTQLDFSANGTTDTADIENMKVWYTGNSNAFATNTQFGSTLAYLPGTLGFTITGTQALNTDTNYFWLTCDVDAGAALGNFIDAECTSILMSGTPQTPSVTAPAGNREVREEYCDPIVSIAVNSCNWGYYTSSFYTSGAVSDITNMYSGCNGNANNYINYANQVLVVNQNQTINLNLGDYNTYMTYAVWIDYDQDGVFDNVTERVFQSPYTGNYGYVNGSITIPCNALPGETRMRVRSADYWWNYSFIPNACADVGYGETEDYSVIIQANPVSYDYSTAEQQTGIAAPGTTDLPVLRLEVQGSNCGVPTAEAFVFSTAGSSSASDIVSAKLYKTGASSSFGTSALMGTVSAPSGQFTFTITDTLGSGIPTYYWLAYDVSVGATLSNVLDATFDSVSVLGIYRAPDVSNPSGNISITSPMTYVSSVTTQDLIQKVGRGTADNQVLGLQVVTSSTGAPAFVTQVDFNLNGTTTSADVTNMKVWYTGNSNAFATGTQFGTTIPYASGVLNYSAIGNQQLMNDTNYFWITYDIDGAAALGNLVDGECTGVTVAGIMQVPSVTVPAGIREIREEYCTPLVSNAANSCNWGYYISSFYTYGAVTDISNFSSGCNGNANNYINYGTSPMLVVNQNQTVTINLGDYSTYLTYAVWIDYNQDGVFNNTTERVFQSPYAYNNGFVNGTFTVPITALTGQTRMRVRGGDWWWTGTYISDACADLGYGETEDYTVMILPEPAPITYVWNQTGTADFGNAYNWTPSRLNPMLNDKLVFNGGGAVTANNVYTQKIGTIAVENNTEVTLETSYYTAIPLIVTDSVVLTSGSITTGTNLVLQLGTDTGHIGTLTGTGSVGGTFRRWIHPAVTSYDFPLLYNGYNNPINVTYTTPPTTGGTLTASRLYGEPGQLGLPMVDGSITVNKVSNFGVWRLKAANGLTGGAYTGTFTADGITDVTNPADLVLTRRMVSIAMWTLNGTSLTTTGTATTPVLSRTGMTVYGEFGVGGDGVINPLPVKLVSFKANAMKGDVLTSWITATEINNAGFEVQRSLDGKTFATVGFVKGKGNSASLTNYTYTDKSAFKVAGVNTLYYRLRQLDNDGKEWISEAATVTNSENKLAGVTAYPNPFNSELHIDIVSTENALYTVSITDLQGKTVFATTHQVMQGINTLQANGMDELNAGIYFLRISGPETKILKLVKTDK